MTAKRSRSPQGSACRLFVEGFFIPGAPGSPRLFTLSEQDSHYVRDVLRLSVGDALEVGDSQHGGVFSACVASVGPLVQIEVGEGIERTQDGSRHVTLLFALCKGTKNDLVSDWATELGCSLIVFWQAQRSVVRLKDSGEASAKAERLSRIARSAAQQSKQSRPPRVVVALSLQEALHLLGPAEGSTRILCSLQPDSPRIGALVSTGNEPTVLAVGPEGDFSPDEEALLLAQGFRPASLGSRVLRSELAAVTALASIQG